MGVDMLIHIINEEFEKKLKPESRNSMKFIQGINSQKFYFMDLRDMDCKA